MASDDSKPFQRILAGVHVLVVDDVADNRDIECMLLKVHGAATSAAESVSAALAATAVAEPDVILTDLHMPGEDGFALLRALRERAEAGGRRLPVVALTADNSDRARDAASEAGFDAVLFKPVEPVRLVRTIAGLVGRY